MRKGGDNTTAAGMPPPTRGPADGRQTNDCALGHDPGLSDPAQKDPLVQRNGARLRNTPRQRLSGGHIDGNDINVPNTCNRYPKNRG